MSGRGRQWAIGQWRILHCFTWLLNRYWRRAHSRLISRARQCSIETAMEMRRNVTSVASSFSKGKARLAFRLRSAAAITPSITRPPDHPRATLRDSARLEQPKSSLILEIAWDSRRRFSSIIRVARGCANAIADTYRSPLYAIFTPSLRPTWHLTTKPYTMTQ
jgi:hypothetical protein